MGHTQGFLLWSGSGMIPIPKADREGNSFQRRKLERERPAARCSHGPFCSRGRCCNWLWPTSAREATPAEEGGRRGRATPYQPVGKRRRVKGGGRGRWRKCLSSFRLSLSFPPFSALSLMEGRAFLEMGHRHIHDMRSRRGSGVACLL